MNRLSLLLLTSLVVSAAPDRLAAEPVELKWDDLLPAETAPVGTQSKPATGPDTFLPSGDGTVFDDPFAAYSPLPVGVVEALDGKEVRLPGFIVPLELDDTGNVREFFLVPYFGACIHVPPPPPNQIVHVTPAAAFPLRSMWEPFWIEGTMSTEEHATAIGIAGYAIRATKIDVYEE